MDFWKSNLRSVRASNLIENTFSMITFQENLVYVYVAHEDVVWSGVRAGRHTCVRCTRKQKRITARKRRLLVWGHFQNIFFDRYFYGSLSYDHKIKYDKSVKYCIYWKNKYKIKLWLFDINLLFLSCWWLSRLGTCHRDELCAFVYIHF